MDDQTKAKAQAVINLYLESLARAHRCRVYPDIATRIGDDRLKEEVARRVQIPIEDVNLAELDLSMRTNLFPT